MPIHSVYQFYSKLSGDMLVHCLIMYWFCALILTMFSSLLSVPSFLLILFPWLILKEPPVSISPYGISICLESSVTSKMSLSLSFADVSKPKIIKAASAPVSQKVRTTRVSRLMTFFLGSSAAVPSHVEMYVCTYIVLLWLLWAMQIEKPDSCQWNTAHFTFVT